MTGPEHYLHAERFLEFAIAGETGSELERYHLHAAQVHATLALAAATALVMGDNGKTPLTAYDEWQAAAGQNQEPQS